MVTRDELVSKLLYPCWRGIDESYKSKYRQTIWQQFEDAIKSASYTDDLAKFWERLSRRLYCAPRAADSSAIAEIVNSNDGGILPMLREQTGILVLMVRVANDARRSAAREQRLVDEEVEREARSGSLFSQPLPGELSEDNERTDEGEDIRTEREANGSLFDFS
jgi:hypothetical protein